MDVAVLSNPTNATGNACIQLYRLSGGSNVPVTASITSESTHSSSKVWETSIDNKAVIVSTAPPASTKSRAKGATQDAGTGAAYIQPRLPETLQWQPDGDLMTLWIRSMTFSEPLNVRYYSCVRIVDIQFHALLRSRWEGSPT